MTSSIDSFSWTCQCTSFPGRKKLLQHRRVTGVLELSVQIIADEIEEGLEIGVSSVLGDLLTGIIEAG